MAAAGSPAVRRRARSRSLGTALVVLAAMGFGTAPVFARMAYDSGADPLAVIVARFLVGMAVIGPLALRRGGQGFPVRGRLGGIAVLGGGLIVSSFGYLGAIRFVPVGIAALVFYIFPLVVTLLSRFVDGVAIRPARAVALLVALVGVGLVAGVADVVLDWRGLGLAASGAVGIAVYIFWGARLTREIGTLPFTFSTFCAAAIIALAAAALFGATLPTTSGGWLGLAGATVIYLAATLSFFEAVTLIEPAHASIVSNVEPLWAIVVAWLVLGEVLQSSQLLGAALVVSAVVLASVPARPPVSRSPASSNLGEG